ncbi:MAG: DCC1-like thiol-disulfide oxidoreductase family protein [Mucilaginibacter sp.]
MKTLPNHLILFDAECPICTFYAKTVTSAGIIEKSGEIAYQDITAETCPMVDRQRAVNELAIVNQTTGEVSYGINSLFKILAVAMPWLKPLLTFKPFIWVMSKVYALFSYNRRLIIPTAQATQKYALQPTFRLSYRLLYLVLAWAITAYILTAYVHLMKGILPQGDRFREYLICGGQIFFQGAIVVIIAKNKTFDYLGNMMTVSLGGALLLIPGLIAGVFFNIAPIVYVLYFMGVAGLMLFEHIRRVGLLNLWWGLSVTWLIYLVLVLLVILK